MSDFICGTLSALGIVDRDACRKFLWGAPTEGAVGRKRKKEDAWNSRETKFSCTLNPQTIKNEGAVDVAPSEIKVHDGDTVKDSTTTYRLLAVDTAEVEACINGSGWPDQYGTGNFSQYNYGQLAKEYVEHAIHTAQSVQKVTAGKIDRYGRTLAYFIVDGQLLQCLLVREGLAWETVSFYGLGSHPVFAQIVLDASNHTGPPNFIEPYLYRQEAKQPCQD